MWTNVNKVVKDSKNTIIYVNVTVGVIGVFYRTVGIKAIYETINAAMFSMILPVFLLSWKNMLMLIIPSKSKGK
jgi:hypothetical protein